MENQRITVKPLREKGKITYALYDFLVEPMFFTGAKLREIHEIRKRQKEKKVSDEVFNAISAFKLTSESNLLNVVSERNQNGTYNVDIKTERNKIHDQSKLLTAVTQAGYAIR